MSSGLIFTIITSNAAIAVVVGALVAWFIKWTGTSTGEKYKDWWGYALWAVNMAEKAIPDDSDNKGLKKFDYACKLFVDKYEKATGKAIETDGDLSAVANLIEQAVETYKSGKTTSSVG